MLVKSTTTVALPAPPPPTTTCGNCGTEERLLLHHVRHRGIFRRLCTSCVLRLHPQSFCPTCFQVYPTPPPIDAVFTCFKCYSSSHSRCVEAAVSPASPPTPYICPLCTQPNAPIFSPSASGENLRVLDLDAAKKLLAAARIASASMNKAAAAARAEAERRAKEAAYTRKRAKEALEYVAHLVMKEKLRNSESAAAGAGITVSRVDNSSGVNASAGYRNGSAVGALYRVDGSNQVLLALNAVGLKENGKLSGGVATEQAMVPIDVDGVRNNNDGGDGVNYGGNVDGEIISDDDVDLVRALEKEMQHDDDDEENSDGGEELVDGPNL